MGYLHIRVSWRKQAIGKGLKEGVRVCACVCGLPGDDSIRKVKGKLLLFISKTSNPHQHTHTHKHAVHPAFCSPGVGIYFYLSPKRRFFSRVNFTQHPVRLCLSKYYTRWWFLEKYMHTQTHKNPSLFSSLGALAQLRVLCSQGWSGWHPWSWL